VIKINLTPYEELENPQWWISDAVMLFLVMAVSFGAVYFYIASVEAEIALRDSDKQRMMEETNAMQSDVTKFNDLNSKIRTLENRKESLSRITESKLVRYLPVILMENIQNLKPDKVWLTSLAFVDKKKPADPNGNQPQTAAQAAVDPNVRDGAPSFLQKGAEFPVTIELNGSAVDNVAVAEFMMALKATQNQTFEQSDLRTQLFFSDVGISFSQVSVNNKENPGDGGFVDFKLVLSFKEKLEGQPEGNGRFSKFIDEFRRNGKAVMN
jgi:Tfp pilus assembly protein PilN